jgi:CPA2 family monovalent cation:H+ antiporter-2
MDAHNFLSALAIVLCVAAFTTVVFQRLNRPIVLGYLLAGLLVGPHVPFPLLADRQIIQTLSELGVILLMFSLGLEFGLSQLAKVGLTAGVTSVVQSSLMMGLGFLTGRMLGWTVRESLFTGAIIAISSTTIIAKAFDEEGIKGPLRHLVVAVLIVEDLIGVLLMAILTAISSSGLSGLAVAKSAMRLAGFLGGLLVVGLLVVPRAIRAVNRLNRPETTVVASVGICFAVALLAMNFGYSVALGAFIAGSLVAESGEAKEVEHRVEPLRDIFGAVFFVSVGMLFDPHLVLEHLGAVAALTGVVIVGKVLSVTLGAFLTGNGTRTSLEAGLSLAQIGEFSFIIAGLGISLGATRSFLYPVAVAVSAITTLTTPALIRFSRPVASYVDAHLPESLQTFSALYGSWIEDLRTAPRRETLGAAVKRQLGRLLVDAFVVAAVIIGGSLAGSRAQAWFQGKLHLGANLSRLLVEGLTLVVALPFAIGLVRLARRLGETLAVAALPHADAGRTDLAAAPRRALVATLQLATLLLVGLGLVAVTEPFIPGAHGGLVLLALLGGLGFAFWRSAGNLEGHVRAGAQVIAEALVERARPKDEKPDAVGGMEARLSKVRELLPGLGDPVAVALTSGAPGVDRTLGELDLRIQTGATVLAIVRGEEEVLVPTAHERLAAGDVLALAGTHEAVTAARKVLLGA